MKRLLCAALVLSMCQGCDLFGGGKSSDGDSVPVATCPPVGPAVPPLVAGDFSGHSNAQVEYLVVGDAVAWSFLHRWVTGLPEPAVNFTTDVVGAVLLNNQPANGLAITLHDPSDARLSVRFPATGPAFPTKPFAFLNVPSSTGQLLFAICPDAQAGVVKNYGALVNEEFQNQPGGWTAAAAGDVASLDAGSCPIDGTPLASSAVEYPAVTGTTYSAHYCPVDGVYWVLHEGHGGGPLGTFRNWFGPFTPGN